MTTTINPTRSQDRRPRREVVDNDTFRRLHPPHPAAHGRRVASGDVEALRDLLALSAVLDHAITTAVLGLGAFGYSWAEIAARLGITRQAAHPRWATHPNPTLNGAEPDGTAVAGSDRPGGAS